MVAVAISTRLRPISDKNVSFVGTGVATGCDKFLQLPCNPLRHHGAPRHACCTPATTPCPSSASHVLIARSQPRKDRQAKSAAIALSRELDSEMTEEERQRLEKSGMGVGGGVNKGEAVLFGACAPRCKHPVSCGEEAIECALHERFYI